MRGAIRRRSKSLGLTPLHALTIESAHDFTNYSSQVTPESKTDWKRLSASSISSVEEDDNYNRVTEENPEGYDMVNKKSCIYGFGLMPISSSSGERSEFHLPTVFNRLLWISCLLLTYNKNRF